MNITTLRNILQLWNNITSKDAEKIAVILHKPQYYHIESLAKELGISRTQAYRLKKRGIIPPPRKMAGFKEKVYTLAQLNQIKKHLTPPHD